MMLHRALTITVPTMPGRSVAMRMYAAAATLVAALVVLAVPAGSHAGTVTTTSSQRATAATVAERQVGDPYRWGATGPTAFDCSGLIVYSYRAAGRPIAARTSQAMWNIGQRLSRWQLRRGDLVWTWDRSLGHVGIYLGNGRYVHSPGAGRRIEIAALPVTGAGYIGGVRP